MLIILGAVGLSVANISTRTEPESQAAPAAQVITRSFYLAPNGNDSSPCTSSQPCKSLKTALSLPGIGSQAGDAIIFTDGVYTGEQQIIDKHFQYPVTVTAATPYKAVLQNTGIVLRLNNAYNLRIADLELKHIEPIPSCDPSNSSAYIIQVNDSSDPGGPFGAKRGPDNVYYDANSKLYPNGTDYSGQITFENNIIHDSYCNDHIKIQNGGDINITGNLFYNQATKNNQAGSTANNGTTEEFIDVNSVFNVKINKNIFFNDFAKNAEPAGYIVVKDSSLGVPEINRAGLTNQSGSVVVPHPNGNTFAVNSSSSSPGSRLDTCDPTGSNCDTIVGSNSITISENIFFNYSTTGTQIPWLQFGAEDTLSYVLNHGLVENNLFIGNGTGITKALFELEGVNNFMFRNNTITGNLPSRHYGYRLKTQSFSQNYPNNNVTIANNIWSDPTGTMGSEDGSPAYFAQADSSGITSNRLLTNNVFWNGGNPIPVVNSFLAQYTEDATRVVVNPDLPDVSTIITPTWNGSTFRAVRSGAIARAAISDVFSDIVSFYGEPNSSTVIDAANPDLAPTQDILGRTRGQNPNIGAFEMNTASAPVPTPSTPSTPTNPSPALTPQPSARVRPSPVIGTQPSPISTPTSAPVTPPTTINEIKINFQPQTASIPSGYLPDYGQVYGVRNGQTYGWNSNIESATRERTSNESLLRNTLIHMQLGGRYTWEIAVPNGTYQVTIMAGDASFTDSLNHLRVENITFTDDSQDNFDYYAGIVNVQDGRITVLTDRGAVNAKLNYILITSL